MSKKIRVTEELIKKRTTGKLTRGEYRALERKGYLQSKYIRGDKGQIQKVYS